jgi:hypothetical protein
MLGGGILSSEERRRRKEEKRRQFEAGANPGGVAETGNDADAAGIPLPPKTAPPTQEVMDRMRARTQTVAFEIEMRENPLRSGAGATVAGGDEGRKGGGERGVGDARLKTMESFRATPAAKGAQK